MAKTKKALNYLKNATNNLATIKYDGDNSTFVWKHPEEDFMIGSQLIVHESQEAIFFLNGEAMESFGPGRHTLETESLPLLNKVFNFATKKPAPFHAEVYFINYSTQMGIKWGTDSRVSFVDPFTGIPFDIGASGELNLKVRPDGGREMLVNLIGTAAGLLRNDFVANSTTAATDVVKETNYYQLSDFFRAAMMSEIKRTLASKIVDDKINILEMDRHLGALSEALKERISPIFSKYALEVCDFFVTTVSLPEDDPNFQQLKSLQTKVYLDVKTQEVRETIAKAERARKITEEETEAQLQIIRAQNDAVTKKIAAEAAAESQRMKGLAEAEVMRQKGYTEKDVIAADVQKAYAESLGKMNFGSSGGAGGAGGGVGGDFVNLAVSMKMAETVMGKMDGMGIFGGEKEAAAAPAAPTTASGWRCSCGQEGNTGKFCGACGKPRQEAWTCPSCGFSGNTNSFCTECGKPKPVAAAAWRCDACGQEGNTGKFCGGCGKPREN